MILRIAKALAGLCLVIVAGALTWGLSWLMQYACSISISEQKFVPTNPASNRLAIATILGVIVVMVFMWLVDEADGCLPFLLAGSLVLGIWLWHEPVADYVFPGTTVSTGPAQVIYAIITALWGLVMCHIFLGNGGSTKTTST